MKVKELKNLNNYDLKEKLTELRKDLMKINAQSKVSTPKSPGKIKHMKRTIARIITLTQNQSKNKSGGIKKV